MKHSSIKKILSLAMLAFIVASPVFASETNGTIVTGGNTGYAWSDQAGWVNFGATNSNVQITDSGITGYVWSNNYGWINMAPTNGGVSVSASGALSGYAWGTNLGWINFSGVSINSSGKFVGQATGAIIGTLTFDCTNCNVTTDYRPQNLRTTTPAPVVSSGGGGGGIPSLFGVVNGPVPPSSSATSVPSTNTPNQPLQAGSAEPLNTPIQVPTPNTSNLNPATPFTAPSQLFDIRLLLDQENVARANALVARVTFESFGRVPTPVDMIFSIVDKDGKSVWKSIDKTTVQTEAVFIKRFSDITLPDGAYTLRLSTRYNTNVTDTFEAPFVVRAASAGSSNWIVYVIGGLGLIIAIFFVVKKKMEKEDEEKIINTL